MTPAVVVATACRGATARRRRCWRRRGGRRAVPWRLASELGVLAAWVVPVVWAAVGMPAVRRLPIGSWWPGARGVRSRRCPSRRGRGVVVDAGRRRLVGAAVLGGPFAVLHLVSPRGWATATSSTGCSWASAWGCVAGVGVVVFLSAAVLRSSWRGVGRGRRSELLVRRGAAPFGPSLACCVRLGGWWCSFGRWSCDALVAAVVVVRCRRRAVVGVRCAWASLTEVPIRWGDLRGWLDEVSVGGGAG